MPSYNRRWGLVLGACLLAAPCAAGAAADPPADTFCPRAVPKLVAFNELGTEGTKDFAKIAKTAREVADEYQLCISEATTRTFDEPRINYDRIRAAQFLVVEGRALLAMGDAKAALQALRNARGFADYVAKYEPMAQGTYQSNNGSGYGTMRTSDKQGSRYREAAVQIEAAADVELAKLNSHPQAQASSKPSS